MYSRKIDIEIECENAAFEDDPGAEVARILRALADTFEKYGVATSSSDIYDVNGNSVGHLEVDSPP